MSAEAAPEGQAPAPAERPAPAGTEGDAREAARLDAFRRAAIAATPRLWVTRALIAINVLVFLAMSIAGVHPLEPTAPALISWGANYGMLTLGGEPWRLLTSMFVHVGLIHIALNMYVLHGVGPLVERVLGNRGFLVMYALSGLGGSLASVWWHADVVSAGASGAVFGVYGALLGYLVRNRGTVPRSVLSSLWKATLAFVGFNILFGVFAPEIDMGAHLGGLVGGFVIGLALALPLAPGVARRRRVRDLVVGLVGLGVVIIALVATPRYDDVGPALAAFDANIPAADDRFTELAAAVATGALSPGEFAEQVRAEVVRPYDEVAEVLAGLDRVAPPLEPLVDNVERYIELRRVCIAGVVGEAEADSDVMAPATVAACDRANAALGALNRFMDALAAEQATP